MNVEEPGRAREHIPNSVSKGGAHRMAERLQRYWRTRGHSQVKVWVEWQAADSYIIRSNLVGGKPPPREEKPA